MFSRLTGLTSFLIGLLALSGGAGASERIAATELEKLFAGSALSGMWQGQAYDQYFSADGAMLESVRIEKAAYPSEPFRIEVRLVDGPYRGVGFICAPIRFVPNCDGIGVRFEETFLSVQ